MAPATTLAQAPPAKAGVVTTLEGVVTARRAALPAPVSLKFKDDVFLRDTITTGERAFARFLLGGKAVVTVRERSVFTITEVPGRSTVDLVSGKIGLAVARERMRQGEVIDVRTPNAVVAVRGTVLVTEVGQTRGSAGAPQPITDVFMIRGTADAETMDPATKAALTKPFAISEFQALNVVGSSPPKVSTFTPAQVAQITAGLRAQGMQHKDGGDQEQVKSQVVGATASVLNALVGTSGDVMAAIAPSTLPQVSSPPTPSPVAPVYAYNTETQNGTVPLTSPSPPGGTIGNNPIPGSNPIPGGNPPIQNPGPGPAPIPTPGPTPPSTPGPIVGLPGNVTSPLVTVRADLNAGAGNALVSFPAGLSNVTGTEAAVVVANARLQQLGNDNVVEVLPGATVFVGVPLLDVQNGAVLSGRRILDVAGVLVTAAPSALLNIDPSTVASIGDFVRVNPGGTLGVMNSLISALGSDVRATARGQLVHVIGAGNTPGGLVANGNLVTFGDSNVLTEGNLLRLVDGGFATGGTGGVPFVTFVNSVFRGGLGPNSVTGGSLLRMFSQAGQPATVLALEGSYLRANDSTLTTTDGPTFNIADGAVAVSTSTEAFASFVGSTVTSASHLFSIASGTTFTAPGQPTTTGSGQPAAVGLVGGLLDFQSSTVTTALNIVDVSQGSLVQIPMPDVDPLPLITAISSTIAAGGSDPATDATTGGRLVRVFSSTTAGTPGAATTVGLIGPLALLTGTSLTTTLDVVGVFNGGLLTSTTTAPLVQLVNSTVNAGPGGLVNRILGMSGLGGPSGTDFATAFLNGPVLSAVNSTLNNPDGVIGIFAGAQLVVRGSGEPLVTIAGGTHALGSRDTGTLLVGVGRLTAVANEVADGVALTLGTDQPIVTARTLLESVGAAITTSRVAFFDHALFQATAPIFSGKAGSRLTATTGLELAAQAKVTSAGPVFVLDASTLDIVTGAAILVNGGSLLRVAGDLTALLNGSTLMTRNGPMIRVTGNSVLNVGGAMVLFGGTGGNLVSVTNNLCPNCTTVVAGIPIALINGATLANITVTNPIKNANLGTLTRSPNAAVIVLDGPNSKVTISGQ